MNLSARAARVVVVVTLAAAGLVLRPAPALAACHFFTVSASPANPREGTTVEVTVTRDAEVQPSSVRVRTIAQTATSGADYTPVDTRVNFVTGTSNSVTVEIAADSLSEGPETFRIEVSEAQGCQINTDYGYGPPATVTIQGGTSAAPSPTPPPSSPRPPTPVLSSKPSSRTPRSTAPAPGGSSPAASSPASSVPPDGSASAGSPTTGSTGPVASASATDGDLDRTADSGSGGTGIPGLLVAGLAAAAAAVGTIIWRRRTARG